ncbi:MAG: fused MFS/spermidine synthase [Deltaproteobacteria bacterium]|nr:fused MFS/spermidine synthase [Deltaproteobacteria bacterium]
MVSLPNGAGLLRPVVLSILVVFGAAIMSLEILASNLMAPYFGSSVYVWGSIISSFMVHLSFGYVLGGRVADRTGSFTGLLLSLAVASAWVLFIPSLVRVVCSALEASVTDVRLGSLLAMNLVFFVPITLMGMVSPYVIHLLARAPERARMSPGTVLFVSTMGSFVGTNLTSFYLIEKAPVSTIVAGIGFLCLVCCALAAGARVDARLTPPEESRLP